jgi:tetratricopeptide (TPR) repeat protein
MQKGIPVRNAASNALARFRTSRHAPALAALAVISFAVLVSTAAKAITFSDAGDFLMGVSMAGNIHGPGYPFFLMTAKVFGWLVPFGSPAFKASLYSAIFASVTTCLIYWIIFRMTSSRAAGALAGLAYCFSYTFWYQSVIPETYSLNTFFISLLIVLALRWERQAGEGHKKQADATMCAFAFVFGLALTNHFSIAILLPAFLFFALDTDWRLALAPRNLLRMAAFAALGLLPYLYEPAAAFRGPAYNYGDPSTPLRWFRHVTVYYQRGGLFKYPYSYLPGRFIRYFGTLTTEFPYFWWLGGVGLLASFEKKSRKYSLFLILLFLFSVLPAMTYKQFESVLRAHFYYESYLVVALFIGFGAAAIVRVLARLEQRTGPLLKYTAFALVLVLALACPLASVTSHYKWVDKSSYEYGRDMARGMLSTAGRDSIILTDDDNVIFPCLYMQVVEKMRPDVRVVSTLSTGVPGFPGIDLLARPLATAPDEKSDDMYAQLVERNFARVPVYSTITGSLNFRWGQEWLGWLVRLYPADSAAAPEGNSRWAETLERSARSVSDIYDCDARWSVLLPQALKAGVYYSRKDFPAAEDSYSRIIPSFQHGIYVPTLYSCAAISQLHTVWGQTLNLQSKFRETTQKLPRALVIDPDFYSLSLASAYARSGKWSEAVEQYDRYLAFHPDDASTRIDLADVFIRLENYELAEQELEEAVRLERENARAFLLYGRLLLLQARGSEARAKLERAIELDPLGEVGRMAREQLELLQE